MVPGTHLIPDLSPCLALALVPSELLALASHLLPLVFSTCVSFPWWKSHRCSSEAMDVCLCQLLWIAVLTFKLASQPLCMFLSSYKECTLWDLMSSPKLRSMCCLVSSSVTAVAAINSIFSIWYYHTPSIALELRWVACEQCSSWSHALWWPCTQVVECSFAC